MAEKFCFQCNKKLGRFMNFGLTDMKKLESPNGMTNDDKICDKCFSNLPKNKEYEKQKALENQQSEEKKKKFDEIKSRFEKHGTVIYKDEYCAIVKKIDDLSFIMAFSDLTREGYRLMAQDEGGQFHLGIASVGAGSYYFFQKIEYVTLKK